MDKTSRGSVSQGLRWEEVGLGFDKLFERTNDILDKYRKGAGSI